MIFTVPLIDTSDIPCSVPVGAIMVVLPLNKYLYFLYSTNTTLPFEIPKNAFHGHFKTVVHINECGEVVNK